MHRRRVLSSTCLGFSALLVGCTGDGNSNDDEETEGPRRDSAFIRNAVSKEVQIAVSLERKSNGENIIDNTYSVPSETGLEIPDVGLEEIVYEVTAEYNEIVEEHEWKVLSCSGGPEVDSNQDTPLEISITKEYFWAGNIDCDESSLLSDLPTENHEDYIVG